MINDMEKAYDTKYHIVYIYVKSIYIFKGKTDLVLLQWTEADEDFTYALIRYEMM